jgi:hypothetical protein
MKTTNLKWIAITLSTLMLLQSCKVYHGATVTQEEAAMSTKRVMVKNFNDGTFKFDRLHEEKGQLYGIAKRRSSTAKLLNEQIVESNLEAKYVKIHLPQNTIREYHLQDRTMSTLITILIPVALIASLALIPTKKTKTIDFDIGL